MNDLISRKAAIEAVRRSEALDRAFGYGHAVDALRELPSAQPEKRTEERTETHACDYIERQAAIDIFDDYNVSVENGELEAYSRDRKRLCDLPSAQPERTGRWEMVSQHRNPPTYIFRCSECGDLSFGMHKFCGECGARMVEVEHG